MCPQCSCVDLCSFNIFPLPPSSSPSPYIYKTLRIKVDCRPQSVKFMITLCSGVYNLAPLWAFLKISGLIISAENNWALRMILLLPSPRLSAYLEPVSVLTDKSVWFCFKDVLHILPSCISFLWSSWRVMNNRICALLAEMHANYKIHWAHLQHYSMKNKFLSEFSLVSHTCTLFNICNLKWNH